MDSSTLLDYALFQLTPTRTRCDLVLFYGGRSEKLASGLFDPFISHLKFVKDEICKGGYSIKLRPPANSVAPWFTKGTFERFVRFVSTPAVLERFVNLEMEISQIDSSVLANELSASNAADQLDEGTRVAADANTRKSSDSYKLKGELEKSGDAIPKENSKIQLQRLLETRKALLRREQAMAYARGLAAGFDLDNTDDLISFADTFEASRLRKACINFKELCKKKLGDGLWMEELAAMQACPPSDFSLLGTSGIILANDFNASNPSFPLNFTNGVPTGDALPNGSDSTSSHASLESKKDDNSATSDQTPSSTTKVPMPMPWPNQIPPYMYNFQSHIHQLPPYQGYPYPTMPHVPPHYPTHMHWPSGMKEHSPAKKERYMKKKGGDDFEDDGETESAESEEGSDSDSCIPQDEKHSSKDASQRRKPRKKSSKTVVIRNINYITPMRRKGDMSDALGASSDEDGVIDEDFLKQQIALEKLHKSNSSRHKTKGGHKTNRIVNGSDDSPAQDSDDVPVSSASTGGKANESWDAFQNILMRAEDPLVNGVETSQSVDVQKGHFTVESSADGISLATDSSMDLGSEKLPKQLKAVNDFFLITQRDGGSKEREMDDFEKAENYRPIMKKRDSMDEDFIISRRNEEPESGHNGFLSSSAAESSLIRPSKGEDWFIIDQSGKPVNQDAASELIFFNGDQTLPLGSSCPNTEKNRKDILVDDSFMVHVGQPIDDLYDSQWKTDIRMAADVTLSSQAENGTVRDNKELLNAYEPNDLCMVLERDSGLFESRRESWTSDPGIDISFMEADRRSSSAETGDLAQQVVKKNETNGRKAPVKEAKSKISPGSIRKSKPDVLSTAKRSPLVSRSIVQKSKLEKEDEMRKKMEELQIQRQKRIAERSAGGGLVPVPAKKSPSESKTTKVSIKLEKNKTHSRT